MCQAPTESPCFETTEKVLLKRACAREGVRVIGGSARPKADALAVLAFNHPIAVKLDLVQQAGASG